MIDPRRRPSATRDPQRVPNPASSGPSRVPNPAMGSDGGAVYALRAPSPDPLAPRRRTRPAPRADIAGRRRDSSWAIPALSAPEHLRDEAACVTTLKNAKTREQEGGLQAAKALLRSCAQSPCSLFVRQQCANRYNKLELDTPTIVSAGQRRLRRGAHRRPGAGRRRALRDADRRAGADDRSRHARLLVQRRRPRLRDPEDPDRAGAAQPLHQRHDREGGRRRRRRRRLGGTDRTAGGRDAGHQAPHTQGDAPDEDGGGRRQGRRQGQRQEQ